MTRLRAALIAATLMVPAIASAQQGSDDPKPEGDAKKPPGEGGQEVELEEDPPPEDMEGTAENPDAPRRVDEEEAVTGGATPPPKATGYPMEDVLRPLTLPAVTSEVSLDIRSTFDPVDLETALRAKYGITRQWQLGLRYLIGGYYDDNLVDMDDKAAFNTGKAFGLDVTYLVYDWLAGHVTLPFYVDPFAMGVTFGAPMKFRFGEPGKGWAIVALDDFLEIPIVKFAPSLVSERTNELFVDAEEIGDVDPKGNLHLRAGVIYQFSPQMAVKGNFVQTFRDFGDNDNPTGIEAMIQYSPIKDMDVSGRLGIDALDQASSTTGLIIAAAYRI